MPRVAIGVKIVSFDLEGTIVSRRFADAFWLELVPRLYSEAHVVDLDEAKRIVYSRYREVGPDDVRWYMVGYWFERLGIKIRPADALKRLRSHLEYYPDAIEALEALSGHYTLILSSNASREFIEVELGELKKYFDAIFSSVSDFNMPRKTAEFYLKVCETLGARPGEVLHVGDNRKYDLEEPRKAGLKAYLIDRNCKDDRPERICSLLSLLKILNLAP